MYLFIQEALGKDGNQPNADFQLPAKKEAPLLLEHDARERRLGAGDLSELFDEESPRQDGS